MPTRWTGAPACRGQALRIASARPEGWLACAQCGDTPLYLLDYDVNLVWVQYGACLRRCGTTPVSAADSTPRTCASCSPPPDPDTYLPYDTIAAPPAPIFALTL